VIRVLSGGRLEAHERVRAHHRLGHEIEDVEDVVERPDR
jgi:hypothetical protein